MKVRWKAGKTGPAQHSQSNIMPPPEQGCIVYSILTLHTFLHAPLHNVSKRENKEGDYGDLADQ